MIETDPDILKVDDYQKLVTEVKKYTSNPKLYLLGKLTEETGEIAKEIIKDEESGSKSDLTSELGDLLWCIVAIGDLYDIKLSEIIQNNISKLQKRNLL